MSMTGQCQEIWGLTACVRVLDSLSIQVKMIVKKMYQFEEKI